MADQKVKGTVSLFCCGGTGANIGSRFLKQHGEDNPGFAELSVYFIDTSRSNITEEIPDEQIFLYKNDKGEYLDGNGHVRNGENYRFLSESSNIGIILDRFKPGNLNIILHSGGGGTGSVAGPLLAKELISRGENVVIMMVGSTTSRLDIINTLKTLKTYENISNKVNNPTIVLYRETSKEVSRLKVDSEIDRYIVLLTAFFSGLHHGLDTSDLRNFLHYNNVTSHKPRLTALDLFSKKIVVPKNCFPLTAVSLTSDNEEVSHDVLVDYQTSGVILTDNFLNEEQVSEILKAMPLHMATFLGFFPPIITRLEELVKKYEDNDKLISARSIINNDDQSNDDGLIF